MEGAAVLLGGEDGFALGGGVPIFVEGAFERGEAIGVSGIVDEVEGFVRVEFEVEEEFGLGVVDVDVFEAVLDDVAHGLAGAFGEVFAEDGARIFRNVSTEELRH